VNGAISEKNAENFLIIKHQDVGLLVGHTKTQQLECATKSPELVLYSSRN